MDKRDALDTPRTAHPSLAVWWTHRRRMAYWSMALLSVIAVIAVFGPVRESVVPLLETICWACALIVIAYFGGNAALDVSTQMGTRR